MASTMNIMNSAAPSAPRVTSTSRKGRRRTARIVRTQGVPASPVATATIQSPEASASPPSMSPPPCRDLPSSYAPLPPTSKNTGGMEDDSAEATNEPGILSSDPEAADEWAQRAIQARDFELLEAALRGLPGGDNVATDDLEPLAARVHGRAVNRVDHCCLEHGLQPEARVLNAAVTFGSLHTHVTQMESQVSLLHDAIKDLRRTIESQGPRPSFANTVATGSSLTTTVTQPGTLKCSAKQTDGLGKKPRRGQFAPTASSSAKPQSQSGPIASSGGRSRVGGKCQSPFCRDRSRNHEIKDCQALREFLQTQRTEKFDSITTE